MDDWKALKDRAVYQGRFIMNARYNPESGDYDLNEISSDIIHYFNKDMLEIGYVAFPYTKYELVETFPDSRAWDGSFLRRYLIERVCYG
jgi:hypothetical protein